MNMVSQRCAGALESTRGADPHIYLSLRLARAWGRSLGAVLAAGLISTGFDGELAPGMCWVQQPSPAAKWVSSGPFWLFYLVWVAAFYAYGLANMIYARTR